MHFAIFTLKKIEETFFIFIKIIYLLKTLTNRLKKYFKIPSGVLYTVQ